MKRAIKEISIDKVKMSQYTKQRQNGNIRRGQDQVSGYEMIVFATDQDLDGFHIRGLLAGFFQTYLPEVTDKIGMLQTPVISVTKKDELQRWYYKIQEITLKSQEESNYMKGLGSWDIDDLQQIIQTDGIQKMIDPIDFDSEDVLENWLGKDSAPRKTAILKNEFNIASL